ncbi:MAG TPA: hypothetical protein VHI13_09435 [Candidatus Kapabacteria bacterium]|nr:hypothetical protein [Candidatus Kapabacteria bacterium]
MGANISGNHGIPPDAEIEKDVAELRQLLSRVPGPAEPHPAYWQNFVVKVRGRIDEEGGRRKRWRLFPAWASLGTAALVTVIVVASGLLERTGKDRPDPSRPVPPAAAEFSAIYSNTDTQSLILSHDDVQMINAIVSDQDDAIFQAMVDKNGE